MVIFQRPWCFSTILSNATLSLILSVGRQAKNWARSEPFAGNIFRSRKSMNALLDVIS